MVYGTQITIVTGANLNQLITGGPYIVELPSGKRLHDCGKIHYFQSVNQLFRLGHFQCRKLYTFTRGFLLRTVFLIMVLL